MTRLVDLPEKPWWTLADQAEFDLHVFDFVDALAVHRPHCPVCSAGGPWCQLVREGFESLLHWRRGRQLRSIAAALRARQDLVDVGRERAA